MAERTHPGAAGGGIKQRTFLPGAAVGALPLVHAGSQGPTRVDEPVLGIKTTGDAALPGLFSR